MKKVLLTNLTKRNFRQDMHFDGSPRTIELPAYALNHEVIFASEEEFKLFETLCADKIESGEIAIGKTSDKKAQEKNEGLEEKEAKAKKALNEQDKNQFEANVNAQLGNTGAKINLSSEKSKKETK